jgi:hypothetical protein
VLHPIRRKTAVAADPRRPVLLAGFPPQVLQAAIHVADVAFSAKLDIDRQVVVEAMKDCEGRSRAPGIECGKSRIVGNG